MDDDMEAGVAKDMNQLSGGEKTRTTLVIII